MYRQLIAFALVLIPSIASAQTKAQTNGGAIADALELKQLDAGPGGFTYWGAFVCVESATVSNPVGKAMSVATASFTKQKTVHKSAVEVLEPGEALNILDHGEAGDNITMIRATDSAANLSLAVADTDDCQRAGIVVAEKSLKLVISFYLEGDGDVGLAHLTGDGDVGLGYLLGQGDVGLGYLLGQGDVGLAHVVAMDVKLQSLEQDDSAVEAKFSLSNPGASVLGTGWSFPPSLLPFVTDSIR